MTPKILQLVAVALAERPMFTRNRFSSVAGVVIVNVLAARAFGFNKPSSADSAVFVLLGMVGFLVPSFMLVMIRTRYKDYSENKLSLARWKAIIQAVMLHAHAIWLTFAFDTMAFVGTDIPLLRACALLERTVSFQQDRWRGKPAHRPSR